MTIKKKAARTFLAVLMPLGILASVAFIGGTATAKKAPVEEINCTSVAATITFTPALVPTTSSPGYSKTLQTTISNDSVSGCTESPTPGTVTASTKATATIAAGKSGNTCSGFAAAAAKSKESFVETWNGTGGTSTASFKGSTVVTGPPAGFALTKGKVTGTYATKTGTITVGLNGPSTAAFAACEGGSGDVSSLTVSSGSATL